MGVCAFMYGRNRLARAEAAAEEEQRLGISSPDLGRGARAAEFVAAMRARRLEKICTPTIKKNVRSDVFPPKDA